MLKAPLLSCLSLGAALSLATPVQAGGNWSGPYIGVNAGYSFGLSTVSGQNFNTGNVGVPGVFSTWDVPQEGGLIAGAQLGYNFRLAQGIVIGVETDFQGTSLATKRATSVVVPLGVAGIIAHTDTAETEDRVDWFGTLRGRVGTTVLSPDLLLFATGGLAYGRVRHSVTVTEQFALPAVITGDASSSSVRTGWTAGAGVEWAPPSLPWSIKIEYLYTDLGSSSLSGAVNRELVGPAPFPISTLSENAETHFHTVRAGINYQF